MELTPITRGTKSAPWRKAYLGSAEVCPVSSKLFIVLMPLSSPVNAFKMVSASRAYHKLCETVASSVERKLSLPRRQLVWLVCVVSLIGVSDNMRTICVSHPDL